MGENSNTGENGREVGRECTMNYCGEQYKDTDLEKRQVSTQGVEHEGLSARYVPYVGKLSQNIKKEGKKEIK